MKIKVHKIALILLFVFLLSMFIVNTQTPATSSVKQNSTTSTTSSTGSYTNVSSITIGSHATFVSDAATYGWPGNGSLSNPFIIQGMRFNSTTSVQLNIENEIEFDNFTIQNNIFENGYASLNYWNLAVWNEDGSTVLIKNNTFQNTNQAIEMQSVHNITIANNKFYMDGSGPSQAIDDFGQFYLNISSNLITNAHEGMNVDTSNAIISDNTIQNTIQGGTDIVDTYASNVSYSGNIFTGSYATGITLSGTSENSFHQIISTTNLINGKPIFYLKGATSGTVPSNSGKVYLVDCVGVTVTGLQPTSSVDYSVYLFNSTNIDITGNTLTSSLDTVTGINSNYVTISGNTLTSSSGQALNLETVNNTVTNNQFYGQVSLKTGDTNLQTVVTGNTVNDGEMVYMVSQSNQVIQHAGWVYVLTSSNIQINNSELDYLSIENSTNIQITNAYTANVGYTTNFDYSKDITIKNVTFINGALEFDFNYDVNVQVIGSTFSHMLITNSNYAVFYFYYSNNTVIRDSTFNNILNDYAIEFYYGVNFNLQNNRFNEMYSDAVYIYSSNPSTVSITYNTFNVAETGLYLSVVNATIQFNIFENNYYTGLEIHSPNNLISFNTFRDNTGYAMYVRDANETISNNIFVNNFDGIYFDGSGSPTYSLVNNNYFTNSGNYYTNYISGVSSDSAIQVFYYSGVEITGNVFNYDVFSLYIDSSASNTLITKNAFLGVAASYDGIYDRGNSNFTANYYDDYTTGVYYIGTTTDNTPLTTNPYMSFNITAPSSMQYAVNTTSKSYSFTYTGPWASYVVASVDNQVVYSGIVNPSQSISLNLDSLGVGNHMIQIIGPTTVTASVFVYNPNDYLMVSTVTNTAVSTATVIQRGSNSSTTSTSSNAKSSPGFTIISILALLVVVPVIAFKKRRN